MYEPVFFVFVCVPVDGVEYFCGQKGMFLCFYVFRSRARGHGVRVQEDGMDGGQNVVSTSCHPDVHFDGNLVEERKKSD